MPLFPPAIDTLRWHDLVRQGRAQLPLVAPDWTDQNTSDPGIALLELISWLIEADVYRAGAVTDRERRLLLELAGFTARPLTPARCLVQVTAPATAIVPKGLVLDAVSDGEHVPLMLVDDLSLTGASIAAVAAASADADADYNHSECSILTRERSAGRPIRPLGPDPAPGDAFLIGFDRFGGVPAGLLDLWCVSTAGLLAPEVPEPGSIHHSAVTVWDVWDGSTWVTLAPPDVDDDSAALSRSGRVRLTVPAIPKSGLGDVTTGVFAGQSLAWIRCRLASGRHDSAPTLVGIYVDVAEAIAAQPFGVFEPDGVQIGVARGIPSEQVRLPGLWCSAQPELWAVAPDATHVPIRLVRDLAHATPSEFAAVLVSDGVTVHFGDGRRGRTLPVGATIWASGLTTTTAATGPLRPPVLATVPVDARSTALLGSAAERATATVVAGLHSGVAAEDIAQVAARAEAALWVHERITETAHKHGAESLDELPLTIVRSLDVPERTVTALDFERRTLSTPGIALWRARALPEVDPRLPGLRASGCITVVVVPTLPHDRPFPTSGLISRVRAELASTRTLGTRVFVVGPDYVHVGVRGTLILRSGADPSAVIASATYALRTYLHPITGGAAGRGWPFGRTVRRTEVLQVLDSLPGVDRVDGLVLGREREGRKPYADCGDIDLCSNELVLAGTIELTTLKTSAVGR